MTARFTWLGHFAVSVEWSGGLLYVDPYSIREKRARPADLVLITNPRLGHRSPEDLELVAAPGTVVAGPAEAVADLPGARALRPGDRLEVGGAAVRAVPAGNRELSFFPLERGWLGYVIRADGRTFYHAGATDALPAMEEIRADVAFLPVSGRYVMDAAEAARIAAAVGATTKVGLFLAGDRYREVEGFVTGE